MSTALPELVRELSSGIESIRAATGLTSDARGGDLREDILLYLRLKILPELDADGALPVFVGVQGGTNVGKSTVFNALCGKLLSPSVVQASATKHPLVYVHRRWRDTVLDDELFPGLECRELEDPKELLVDADRTELLYFRFHEDDALAAIALIDSPDFDSALETNLRVARYMTVLSDVTVFVTTAQKYKDRALVEHLRLLNDLKACVVLVFNMVDEEIVFRTLLDDLRETVDFEHVDLTALRVGPSSSAHPEDEIRGLVEEHVLGKLRSLDAGEIKPRILGRTCRRVAVKVTELTARFSREAKLADDFRKRIQDGTREACAEYDRSFRLALPEETLAVRRLLSLTELGPRLTLSEDVRRSNRALGMVGAAIGKVTEMGRILLMRLSNAGEGSLEDTPTAVAEYAAARNDADFENVLRSAEGFRLALEGFFRAREASSPLAQRVRERFFSTERRAAFADELRPVFDREVEIGQVHGEAVLAAVESWIHTHRVSSHAITWSSIALKLGCGGLLAWLVPPGSGPLSILNWAWFVLGYFVAAYGIALTITLLLRRKNRFRKARRKTMRFVLDAALVKPVQEYVSEILDRDTIQRLDRLAGDLLEHPDVRDGAE